MSFIDELKQAVEEGKKNKEIRDRGGKPEVSKVSLLDKIKGITGAFKRVKDKGDLDKIWADEEEVKERVVCCTTCTDGNNCPYCGCQINKSWFLPLGKSELTTEGCPNKNTYPHLKRFPPRNFWDVCKETTTVLMPVGTNEKPHNFNRTIESLIDNSTGKIEILVLLDGWITDDIFKSDCVKVIVSEENIGIRRIVNMGARIATGKYIFRIDAHCSMSYGWDTKLKCACNGNNFVNCVIDAIDEETWKGMGHNYTFVYIDTECSEKWWGDQYKKLEDCNLIEKTMSLTGCGWMTTKDFYWNVFKGFDENIIGYGCEGQEISLKVYPQGGEINLRKDVVCGHFFYSNPNRYSSETVDKIKKYLLSKYRKDLFDLVKMFSPVPGWDMIDDDRFQEIINYKDKNDNIIRKIIKEFNKNDGIPVKIYDNKIENEKWISNIISDREEIRMWIFENEV